VGKERGEWSRVEGSKASRKERLLMLRRDKHKDEH